MVTLTPGALEYAQKHVLHALVVAHDGRIVSETYGQGHDAATPHALYSGTKSFWGTTALIAQRQGLLRLDECVAETFPEWKRDPWKSQVTLRQLLQLTSGIGFGGLGTAVPTYAKALAVELKNEPGTVFTYGGIPLQVFGAVLARKLEPRGLTPHEYLKQQILDTIGMKVDKWRALSDKTSPLPTGAFVSAREWLKYGQFVCDQRHEFDECFYGSPPNPRYGLAWWLGSPHAPSDLVYASGAAGQAMYVVPSLRTVVVHFGKSSSFKHDAFLKRLFSPTA
ncbi:MAG TPA: serine hydrolase [Candidatus Eremiobacteraceae bacterium]|nr:serine hydrolase [Candidatus Eremiobacteraceae bacterium]